MNPQVAQNYLRTRVLTATPEQLQLMLYDGAIRFAEQARPALEARNWEVSHVALTRAQKIMTELTSSLRHDVAADMCGRLAGLYNFVYRKLVEANVNHQVEPLDDALRILRYQRETWALLMEQLGKQKAATAAKNVNFPEPSSRMEASISVQG
ncbi:MAG TPA: flagellar export chaperone FliS [Tepidisphaeraceae bacterium]|nr:flagellar export chaperone FliS [Tepidisphaeraceae bacterium]